MSKDYYRCTKVAPDLSAEEAQEQSNRDEQWGLRGDRGHSSDVPPAVLQQVRVDVSAQGGGQAGQQLQQHSSQRALFSQERDC
jgi:hypothetical protein